MIELDLVAYLKADAILDGLLNSTASDSKIYPIQKPQTGVVPYLVYNIIDEGTTDENLLEMVISFECVDNTYADLILLSDRIYELLDIQNDAQNDIDSVNYYIYWTKVVGGRDSQETDFNYPHKTLNVHIKYHRKSRW